MNNAIFGFSTLVITPRQNTQSGARRSAPAVRRCGAATAPQAAHAQPQQVGRAGKAHQVIEQGCRLEQRGQASGGGQQVDRLADRDADGGDEPRP